ncbi:hypothetical protein E1B28_010821 [Marasmius oreades]|uniref:Mug135-like C-terminal domain-containing protein n=1 Tax=Marasmius oreades TaxID=181124 RepID=A0A9P7RT08_9AGAR|nr:uncharacterized protein E1B28_010821 [Marasmius oreades]KAG7089112.1 hypothetical protein E1B28_010821 [Marasmius oreades]
MAHTPAPVLSTTGILGNLLLPPAIALDPNNKIRDADKRAAVQFAINAAEHYLNENNPAEPGHVDLAGVADAKIYETVVIMHDHLEERLQQHIQALPWPQGQQPPPWFNVAVQNAVQNQVNGVRDDVVNMRTAIVNRVNGIEGQLNGMRNDIEGQLNGVRNDIENLNVKITQLSSSLTPMVIMSQKRCNVANPPDALTEVLFPDGTKPWGKEVTIPLIRWKNQDDRNVTVTLPPLNSLAAIQSLKDKPDMLNGYLNGYYSDYFLNSTKDEKLRKVRLAVGRS